MFLKSSDNLKDPDNVEASYERRGLNQRNGEISISRKGNSRVFTEITRFRVFDLDGTFEDMYIYRYIFYIVIYICLCLLALKTGLRQWYRLAIVKCWCLV